MLGVGWRKCLTQVAPGGDVLNPHGLLCFFNGLCRPPAFLHFSTFVTHSLDFVPFATVHANRFRFSFRTDRPCGRVVVAFELLYREARFEVPVSLNTEVEVAPTGECDLFPFFLVPCFWNILYHIRDIQ